MIRISTIARHIFKEASCCLMGTAFRAAEMMRRANLNAYHNGRCLRDPCQRRRLSDHCCDALP